MDNKVEYLNKNYSTTKLCYKLLDDKYLDGNGKIKEEYKFKLNFPEFGIVDSKIPAKDGEKFDTLLFLLEGEERKGEGGLRTKGYFKFSYEKKNGKWWIVEDNKFIKEVELDENIVKDYEKLPLISIITVVFNGEKYLEETIQSVINQIYPNVEYIIIDGGSTDGTLDIIKKYEDKIDYWVSERDKGIYDAMNKGIDLANGEWINFMNAGDRFYDENVLEKIFLDRKLLKDNIILLVGNHSVDYEKIIKHYKINPKNVFNFYKGMPFSHQSSVIKLSYHKKNKYKLQYKIAADFEFFYEIYKYNIKKIKVIDMTVSITSTGGISDTKRIKSIKEWWSIVGKNNMKINLFYIKLIFITYCKEFIKKILGKNLVNLIRAKIV